MESDLLVCKSRVRIFLKQSELRVSEDFYKALSDEIKKILLKAAVRAKNNNRSTVMEVDL